MDNMNDVLTTNIDHAFSLDIPQDRHGCTAAAWSGTLLNVDANTTHYGVVLEGPAELRTGHGTFTLGTGFYFSVPGRFELSGGRGMLASKTSYTGFFKIGGPIETHGRLRYIDGCTDSLLISPPVKGDPCLNFLYIPPNLDQTAHTHPSCRIGLGSRLITPTRRPPPRGRLTRQN